MIEENFNHNKHVPVKASLAGRLENRKVSPGKRPLFVALIILGVIGAGVLGVGIAGLGVHQGWWAAGGLTNLTQLSAIIMMGTGGVGGMAFFIIGIVGIVKTHQKKEHALVDIKLKSAMHEGASYARENNDGVLDLVYSDSEHWFAFVADGTGHGNPIMRKALKEHFDAFFKNYVSFEGEPTPETLTQHFNTKMDELNSQFNDPKLPQNQEQFYTVESVKERITSNYKNDLDKCTTEEEKQKIELAIDKSTIAQVKDYQNDKTLCSFLETTNKPAMSFVQLLPMKDKLHLLTAQAGDTMVVVEMKNGDLLTTQESTSGVGVGLGITRATYDITGAKRVIGFSDGIGDFMTFAELKEIINETETDQLFDALSKKVMTKREFDKNTPSANDGGLHKYDPTDHKKGVDDMGLFVLEIQE